MQWGGLKPGPAEAGSGYAKLSAAGGGESEAEHWAVPQSSAVRRKTRSSATRHNRVKSLMLRKISNHRKAYVLKNALSLSGIPPSSDT